MKFLANILVTGLAVLICAKLLPGIDVPDMLTAVIVATVLALLNAVVKPILILLTIPITLFTLGLFLLVINAFIIMLAGAIVKDFHVRKFLVGFIIQPSSFYGDFDIRSGKPKRVWKGGISSYYLYRNSLCAYN